MSRTQRRNDARLVKLAPVLGIAFPGGSEGSEPLQLAIEVCLRDRLSQASGILYAITIGGPGDCLLFAETCIALGIPLQLLLPTSTIALLASVPDELRARIQSTLKAALSIESIGSPDVLADALCECANDAVQRSGLVILVDETPLEVSNFAKQLGRVTVLLNPESHFTAQSAAGYVSKLDPELSFLNSLPDPPEPLDAAASPLEVVQAWFRKIDLYATAQAPQTKHLASLPLFFTALAALLSGLASRSTLGKGWIAASAAFGGFAALLPLLLRIDHKQALWARTRIAAEVTRSVLALWDAPSRNEILGEEVGSELSATLMSLRFLKLKASAQRTVALETFKQNYLRNRIVDQRLYYARHAACADAERKRYRLIARGSIACAVLLALSWGLGVEGVPGFRPLAQFRFFGVALSLLFQFATITAALEFIHDSGRRQRRYWELHAWLLNWEIQFAAARTWTTAWDVVSQVERALIAEILEWRSLARNTKLTWK